MSEQLTYGTQVDLYIDALSSFRSAPLLSREIPASEHNQRVDEWASIADSLRPIKNWEGPNS